MSESRRQARKNIIRETLDDRVFNIINIIIMAIMIVVVLYPLWFVVIASISDYQAVGRGEVVFWPVGFQFDAYTRLFERDSIIIGYRNTLFYSIFGTVINLICTLTAGYVFSVKFPGRKFFMFFITFTMYFGGGIIPTYFVYKNLKLINTIWVLLIPGAFSTYNIIVARTFISSSIPSELAEAAEIDGCGKILYYLRIVIPLSTVLINVLVLFFVVGHWNSYFNAMMFLSKKELFPLQLVARDILINNQITQNELVDTKEKLRNAAIAEQIKYSLIVVASMPVIVLYLFLQKYFVKGIMIGSIKG